MADWLSDLKIRQGRQGCTALHYSVSIGACFNQTQDRTDRQTALGNFQHNCQGFSSASPLLVDSGTSCTTHIYTYDVSHEFNSYCDLVFG